MHCGALSAEYLASRLGADGRLDLEDGAIHARMVSTLLEWGILVEDSAGVRLSKDVDAITFHLFIPLIDTFGPVLKQVRLPDCPLFFCSGLVELAKESAGSERERGTVVAAGGQGATAAQAAVSCLGEMAERISLFAGRDHDPRLHTATPRYSELSLGSFLGFSQRQEFRMRAFYPGFNQWFQNGKIDWNQISSRRVLVSNLKDGSVAEIPSLGVLLAENADPMMSDLSLASTSGTAVWSTYEKASERALRELVERDAFGQAWYNRLGITCLNGDDFGGLIPKKIVDYLLGRARNARICYVDTNLSVHIVAAFSYSDDGLGASVGVSAARTTEKAALSAVCEMLQGEYSLDLSARAYRASGSRGAGDIPPALAYGRRTSIVNDLNLHAAPVADTAKLERVYTADELEASCHDNDIELWRFDATRAELGVPCIKILSPDLCSWQPRFGKQRLFNGVVERGLAVEPGREEDFERRPFPF